MINLGRKSSVAPLLMPLLVFKIIKYVANFVIQTGINDTKEKSGDLVKRCITLIDTVKQYNSKSKIYVNKSQK